MARAFRISVCCSCLLSTRYSRAGPPASPPQPAASPLGAPPGTNLPGAREWLLGCAMWGLRLVGTAGNTILCVPRLVTRIAGSARTYGATHRVTDLSWGPRFIGPASPRSTSWGPGHPCPALLPGSGHGEEFAQAPSHKHLNIHISQSPKLQSKETFVKESSAQTVPEETPTM